MSVFDPANRTLRFRRRTDSKTSPCVSVWPWTPADPATLAFAHSRMTQVMPSVFSASEVCFAAMLNGLKVEWVD